MEERLYWLGFSVFSGIGPIRFRKLLEHFGSAKSAWEANIGDLKKGGLGDKTAVRFEEHRRNFSINDYFRKLKDSEVDFLTISDFEYPRLLAQIKNPPIVLYVKGGINFNGIASSSVKAGLLAMTKDSVNSMIAVVGTRNITTYGSQVTGLVARDLVDAGCVIVSGLAMGVDSRAHSVAIENKGRTIAVLGSGVDVCTPRENILLYKKILDSDGLIVSEFPLGQEPQRGSFPSRNRIIAGLCAGVVVTEGSADSGALITAEDAFANNRKVFAVPGPITSDFSKGPNSLIAKGAIPVSSASDILRSLGFDQGLGVKRADSRKRIKGETKEEQVIIDFLQAEQMHIDELIKKTGILPSEIGTILSFMEMKGMVRNLGSGIFGLGEI